MNRQSACFIATLLLMNAAMLAGCLEPEPDEQTTGPENGDAAPPADAMQSATNEESRLGFRSLAEGADIQYPGGARLVITDAQAWEQFWTQSIGSNDRPTVDFAQEIVVAVLMQEQTNGCLRINVVEVTQGNDAAATVHSEVSGPRQCALTVMGQAYHVIAMPAAETVLFQEARVDESTRASDGTGYTPRA